MKIYCIFTVQKENGVMTIIYSKNLFLFIEDAFEEAKVLGENSCVLELTQTFTWNYEQIKQQNEEALSASSQKPECTQD